MKPIAAYMALVALCACSPLEEVGRLPDFKPIQDSAEASAMIYPGLPKNIEKTSPTDGGVPLDGITPIPFGGPSRR